MTHYRYIVLLVLPLFFSCSQFTTRTLPALDSEQMQWIGERIFENECNLKIPCLTSWNMGENFPSLGIGHFIWYRENQEEAFVESFPELLNFYAVQRIEIPHWISVLPGKNAPWENRAVFLNDIDSQRMLELREFLAATRHIQAAFIIRRMQGSLPALISASSRPREVEALIYEIAHTPGPLGMYSLIDYVNFKGTGTAPSERYQGQGWGLLQVLEHMLESPDSSALMSRFASSARFVLARRVANAPADRGEERWLNGWNNRIATYEGL